MERPARNKPFPRGVPPPQRPGTSRPRALWSPNFVVGEAGFEPATALFVRHEQGIPPVPGKCRIVCVVNKLPRLLFGLAKPILAQFWRSCILDAYWLRRRGNATSAM